MIWNVGLNQLLNLSSQSGFQPRRSFFNHTPALVKHPRRNKVLYSSHTFFQALAPTSYGCLFLRFLRFAPHRPVAIYDLFTKRVVKWACFNSNHTLFNCWATPSFQSAFLPPSRNPTLSTISSYHVTTHTFFQAMTPMAISLRSTPDIYVSATSASLHSVLL